MKGKLTAWTVLVFAALILSGCELPPTVRYSPYDDIVLNHQIAHNSDGRNWAMIHYDYVDDYMIHQWIPKKTKGEPRESISYEAFIKPAIYTAQDHAIFVMNKIQPNAVDFEYEYMLETPLDVMLMASYGKTEQSPAQRILIRIIKGTDGIYSMIYAVDEASYDESIFGLWAVNMESAKLERITPDAQGTEFEKQMELIQLMEDYRALDFFVMPYFPEEQLARAKREMAVPASETVLGFIDGTNGSGKHGLLICSKGIYMNNSWSGKTPGQHYFPYDKFKHLTIEDGGWFEIAIGQKFFCSASVTMKKDNVIEMLQGIQGWVVKYEMETEKKLELDDEKTTLERMKELEALKESGLISTEEYEEKRKAILHSI